jgi:hypothetical protein
MFARPRRAIDRVLTAAVGDHFFKVWRQSWAALLDSTAMLRKWETEKRPTENRRALKGG